MGSGARERVIAGRRVAGRRVAVLVATLSLSGCALSTAQGWGTRSPDGFPRGTTIGARGPFVRESALLYGAELQLEEDDGVRVRRGGAVVVGRATDRSLGIDGPWAEVGGALGGGRGNFDPDGEHIGAYLGVRAEAGVPMFSAPRAHRAEVRLLLVRGEIFVFAHGDAIAAESPVVEGQAGLGLRLTLSSDAAIKDALGDLL